MTTNDDMYERAYWDIQKVLDKALGEGVHDGEGAGIVADVQLVVDQRDEYQEQRNALTYELEKVRAQLTAANHHADGLTADLRSAQQANTAYANENAELRKTLGQIAGMCNCLAADDCPSVVARQALNAEKAEVTK